MHKSKTLRGWRKIGVVAGSLAILAAGGAAGVAQAFADPGQGEVHQTHGHLAKQQAPKQQAPKQQATEQQATKKQATKKQATKKQARQIGQPMDPLPGKLTGREVTVALYGAVTDLVPGEGSHFAGQGSYGDWLMGQGDFRFAPADGSAPGWVGVGIMHESMYRGYVPTCDDPLNDLGESCKLTKQEDGSTLMTYAVEGDKGLKSLVVERYVGDIRVTVEANNSAGPSRDQVNPTGSVPPVLTLEQLTSIANQTWWSVDAPLDAPYEDTLPSYGEHVPTVVG